MQDLKDCK